METILIGSDHGGFAAKEQLTVWLKERGYQVDDGGAHTYDGDDDYPVYATAVARAISRHPNQRGILLCRSGQGVAIVGNKFPHVRAAVAWNPDVARAAAEDDAVNLLCLPAEYCDQASLEAMTEAWLASSPKTGDNYHRRLEEIRRIEEEIMRN
ncbi:RpiB/LacA/LacB family sugar-phosphate isomerase [Candidatus Berkelbacteria bacterium]|nr:RpiB/LacA/LacB family sugar-phosphate isomerase [Candidatus Berkelbacteria bacterium]